MIKLSLYLNTLIVLIPVFSGVSCAVLMGFSVRNCLLQEECDLKKIVTLYLVSYSIAWFALFCYGYAPQLFLILNVPCMFSFMIVPVLFYRIVHFLTRLERQERFAGWHYLAPLLLPAILFVWSFFVPAEIQMELIAGKGKVVPEGYEAYSRLFLSKPGLHALLGLIYYTLSILQLMRYYKRVSTQDRLIRKPTGWVIFLLVISVAILLTSLPTLLIERNEALCTVWLAVASVVMVIQYVLLTYHIICRQYLPYVVRMELQQEKKTEDDAPEEGKSQRRYYSGRMTRQKLETYFRNEKPYLRTDFKLAELVEVLDVNRTVISTFINETYGVNFNRYVNGWRLKEAERLAALPHNAGKSVGSYITKAGFSDLRQYYRVLCAERKGAENNEKAERSNKKNEEEKR